MIGDQPADFRRYSVSICGFFNLYKSAGDVINTALTAYSGSFSKNFSNQF